MQISLNNMVVLLLIDGWGVAPANDANAIAAAKTPVFLNFIKEYPVALLSPSSSSWNARYLALGSGQDIQDENTECSTNLSLVISQAGLRQVKIAETERFAALTHFFNTQHEDKYSLEDWKIISSTAKAKIAKPVLTLRKTAKEITKTLNDGSISFIAAALPCLDLTAAGGDMAQTRKAVEAVDKALKEIYLAVAQKEGVLIITSAGGNAEKMKDIATDLPDAGLTDNPVPFLIIGADYKGKTIGLADPLNNDLSSLTPAGTLADVAPTILKILGLPKSDEMTGISLVE